VVKKLIVLANVVLCVVIFGAIAGGSAFAANKGAGIVRVSELCLRTQPNENARVLAYADKGDNVMIIAWASEDWYEVVYKNQRGYMKGKEGAWTKTYIAPVDSAFYDIGNGEIVGENVRLRSDHSTDSTTLETLQLDDQVKITGVYTEWYQVTTSSGKSGYVHCDYVRIIFGTTVSSVTPLTTEVAAVQKTVLASAASYTANTGDINYDKTTTLGKMAELAIDLLGTKYKYAGASPKTGFDCSGFVMYIAGQFGYDLPHSSRGMQNLGTKVDKSELKLGDLVFFGPGYTDHVGIYLGNNTFIHSSSGAGKVKYNSLDDSYYKTNYRGARRVF